jgi:hypothetical protein
LKIRFLPRWRQVVVGAAIPVAATVALATTALACDVQVAFKCTSGGPELQIMPHGQLIPEGTARITAPDGTVDEVQWKNDQETDLIIPSSGWWKVELLDSTGLPIPKEVEGQTTVKIKVKGCPCPHPSPSPSPSSAPSPTPTPTPIPTPTPTPSTATAGTGGGTPGLPNTGLAK